jgi:hypothetical protein
MKLTRPRGTTLEERGPIIDSSRALVHRVSPSIFSHRVHSSSLSSMNWRMFGDLGSNHLSGPDSTAIRRGDEVGTAFSERPGVALDP